MLDLEAEYNNRARVPEHPQIFASWTRDAARYRMTRQGHCALDVVYGAGDRQRYDIFKSDQSSAGALIVFIHGGYWQSLGRSSFSHMAQGANAHGFDMVMAGYTLCPDISIGGIVEEIQNLIIHLARQTKRRMVVMGHSAGAHLAAMMCVSKWSALAPDLGYDPITAAVLISGVYELEPLIVTSINSKLGLDRASAEALSPRFMPGPKSKRLVAVVGALESSEFLRQQRSLVGEWSRQGTVIRGVEVEGADHFTVINPLAMPDSDLTQAVISLASP